MSRHLSIAALLWALLASCASAQGLLVSDEASPHYILPRPRPMMPTPHAPSPPAGTYRIKELSVQVRLANQVAQTQVTQSFVNTGSATMEVRFVFPLPYDGAIDQLTLLVDGKEYAAKLLPKDEARKVYEDIVRRNRDPALLEWINTGMFQTSVFPVPPGVERKVTLKYSQLCRQDQGITDYLFPLATAKYTSEPIDKIEFTLALESPERIKNVYSPTHNIDIKRPDDHHAMVSYQATKAVPGGDFRVMYDVGSGTVGAKVLSFRKDTKEDGFFLLLASPEINAQNAERLRKTVVFCLDRSGSMSGEKFRQAQNAVKFVLNNLREGDLFNIISYETKVESFRPELQKLDEETRKAALGYVEGLFAGGSTNLDGAMQLALGMIKDPALPSYVLFLTDGLPTVGERSEVKIAATAKSANAVHARIFTFGVGYDVNSRLLDKLVSDSFGQSVYVRPNEDIEAHVSQLYARIGAPVMTGVETKFELDTPARDSVPVTIRQYPNGPQDLFAGQQLVLVGRYKKNGVAKVTLHGKVAGADQEMTFPANLVEKSSDDSLAFIERLWAVRRIGEILDELDLNGKNEELVKELVQLSTKHGVLTPYTSFLADESTKTTDLAATSYEAEVRLRQLSEVSGVEGVAQRSGKQSQKFAYNAPLNESHGFGGSVPAASASGALPADRAKVLDISTNQEKIVETVQNVGRKTFYRRGSNWVDGSLSKEQEAKQQHVARFSKEYFALVDKYGAEVTPYLAVDEPITVEIDGAVYAIE